MDDLAALVTPSYIDPNSTIAAPIVNELIDELDLEQCRLLGPFALVIQAIMGALVLLSLVVKRMRERPRRKWKIWLGDVSKQVVGQAFVHASNVAISALIATHNSDNACSLYALNILIDTTLGVLLLYYFLRLSTHLMQTYRDPGYATGYYGPPPSFSLALWGEQAAVYVACLAAMKVAVVVLFWILPGMEDVVSWALAWITNDEAQVFVVMLVLPLVMNIFQFLVVDSIIKSPTPSTGLPGGPESDEEALRRGFLDANGDGDETFSDDDDDHHHRRARGENGGPRGFKDDDDEGDEGDELFDADREEETGARGAARGKTAAEQGLLDAEEGGSDNLHTSRQHTYPPSASSSSAPRAVPPRAASVRSTTSSLPPYSTLPPPGAHGPLAAVKQQHEQRQQARQSEDDDGWGERWSGDEEEEADRPPAKDDPLQPSPSIPSTATFPALAPSTSRSAMRPSSPAPASVSTPSQPSSAHPTASPSASRALAPTLAPTAPDAKGAGTALGTSTTASREEEEPEDAGGEDEWGFGEEEQEANEGVLDAEVVESRAVEPPRTDDPASITADEAAEGELRMSGDDWGFGEEARDNEQAEDEAEELVVEKKAEEEPEDAVELAPASHTSPSTIPPSSAPPAAFKDRASSAAPTPASPVEPSVRASSVAEEEKLEEEDDWGLEDAHSAPSSPPPAPASPPGAPTSTSPLDLTFSSPPDLPAADEAAASSSSPPAPPSPTLSAPPLPFNSDESAPRSSPSLAPTATSLTQPEDEDDWGFGATSPAAPPAATFADEAAQSPLSTEKEETISTPLSEEQGPVDSAAPLVFEEKPVLPPPSMAEEEKVEELSEKQPLPPFAAHADDEEDDDWGFDDSPSLTAENELQSEVDRVLGLKHGANEKLEGGGEKVLPPAEVGKVLDVGGLV
ncbi:hypothetical protein JCM11251_004237 [Rhodosporidiobolus azoricus]